MINSAHPTRTIKSADSAAPSSDAPEEEISGLSYRERVAQFMRQVRGQSEEEAP